MNHAGRLRDTSPPAAAPVVLRAVRTAAHLIGEGLRGLLISPGQVVACLLSLAIASCLLTLFASFGTLSVSLLDRAARQAHLLVYLKEEVPADRIQALIADLRARPDVRDVRYLTAGEDRARNAELLPRDVVNSLPADAIPGQHAIEVRIEGASDRSPELENLMGLLRTLSEVDVVAGPPVGADRIRAVAAAVRFARLALTLLAVLLFASIVFFVVGTLTRTMERRRDEMAILRIVGATSAYLKTPIYVQGLIQGIAGVVSGVFFGLAILSATDSWARRELAVRVPLEVPFGPALAASVAIGAAVGLLGALLATSRRLP